ncbi:uncharacterized protein Z519_12738 [Cladophialophora bantiana CBS 173.52]|uniref:Methyltransferase domain-containing protein n=1 Tax=Cladophialophora bantiana (strain ATCC 10958 / CBS 173.52 / CDC B-1940 / NIH 8579) TaxID=1442370 RepID=A0A0D2H075_CLAB1|nr:uncharacterized protein Z519_12738 [Cladophialophora bantiana CBS 173.52]KIW86683.1 hypothetical protein Z519_12738 [Cladophialophora bantiana CBS 173.52]
MATTPEIDELELNGQIQSPQDSAIGDARWSSSTFSVRPEALGCSELHGRLYGRGIPFPIDDRARDEHDLQNHLFQEVLKKLYCAPVNLNGGNVHEMYTRTGIWAIDVGDEDASCSVIGTDESVMQTEWVSPNVEFQICDVEDDGYWTWRTAFRFIFYRGFGGVVKDLPALIHRCHEHLEPGGWLEFQLLALRHDSQQPSPQPFTFIQELHRHLSEGLSKLGRKLDIHDDLPQILRENHFRNIKHIQETVPLGPWSRDPKLKEIGHIWKEAFSRQLQALSLKAFIKGLEWDYGEYEGFLAHVQNELEQWKRLHMRTTLHVIYAQKPSN